MPPAKACSNRAARRRRERYRRFFVEDLAGHYVTSAAGTIIDCNDAFARMFGFASAAEARGRAVAPLYPVPELRRRFLEVLVRRRSPQRFEIQMRRLDGTPIYLVETAAGVFGDDGELVEVVGNLVEDGYRLNAEDQLRQYLALLEKATDAIIVQDPDGRVEFWNQGAARLYGWSSVEAVGRDARRLLLNGSGDRLPEILDELAARGEWSGEIEMVAKNGRRLTVQSRWTVAEDSQGRPSAILVIDTDVTEARRLETQALRAQRMESLGTLAGGIAHDLNNVLAPILMTADLLEKRLQEPEELAMLQTIEAAALHGKDLIRQVLWFSRGVEGKRTPLRLEHLIQDVGRIIQDTFPRSIEIVLDLAPDLRPVMGDPTQLHQVLMNLCVNARDAMPCVGILHLAAGNRTLDPQAVRHRFQVRPGAYVCLEVTDTGVGIAEEDLDKILEPFFTTKEPGQGTGLGLSTVHAIVTSHGGFLEVESEPGKGTTFRVYLPAAEAPSVEVEERATAAEPPRGEDRLILVADDDPAFREVLRAILYDHGYRVLAAGDGAEAVALFADHHAEIAAVLVDLVMPCLDGVGTIRALRRIEPGVQVVAMSGTADQWGSADRIGAAALLEKPFKAPQLFAALGRAMGT